MTFDPTKPVMRDGKLARIVCRDAKGCAPILALTSYGNDEVASWHFQDGRQFGGYHDLVNIPETVTTWQNVYANGARYGHGDAWSSRADADKFAKDRVAVLILRTTGDVTTAELEPVERAR